MKVAKVVRRVKIVKEILKKRKRIRRGISLKINNNEKIELLYHPKMKDNLNIL